MKNTTGIIYFLLILVLIAPLGLTGQNAKFTASVNKTNLQVGEKFQLQFKLNTSGDNFTPPNLGAFRLLSGPNQSTSMQFINGAMSSSVSYSYILIPVKEGKFTIDPAAIRADGKVVKSNAVELTVSKNAAANASPGKQQNQSSTKVPAGSDKYLFIKATVSKQNPYVGEQITATYRLYTRQQVVDGRPGVSPALNGFWSNDIEVNQNQRTEVINGERYTVIDLKQTALFPQRSGELSIDPLQFTFVVRQQTQRRSRSLFDQFFGSYQDVQREIKSKAIKIKVKPLPGNKPADFNGAVGKFKLNATVNKSTVKANESIDLEVTINGTGNLKLMENPNLKLPSDFEVYDPEIKDNISVKASGVKGSRTYHYLIIPRHKGSYVIEPITFSYFNPASKSYETVSTSSFNIEVEKGEAESDPSVYSGISKEDVKILGDDIKYIRTLTTPILHSKNTLFGKWTYYALLSFPILLFPFLLMIRNKQRAANSDLVRVRSSRATKMARKRLAVAKSHLDKSESEAFYEEVSKAILGFTADKLNMNYADLSKENIQSLMRSREVSENTVTKLIGILETCEMARFAPVAGSSQQALYEEASEVLKSIENELKA